MKMMYYAHLLIGFLCFRASRSIVRDKLFLKGTTFRVSGYEQLPFLWTVRDANNVTYDGAAAEVVTTMAQYFDMHVSYVRIDPAEFTKWGGGYAVAMQLRRNEVDFVTFPIVGTLQYAALMDFTVPTWVENYILMQPFPEEQSRLVAPIRPFSGVVWLLFLVSTAAFVGVITLMLSVNRRSLHHQDRPELQQTGDVYFGVQYVLTIITAQGNYITYTSQLSLKILACSWLLAMIVFVNAYAGLLTAYLTVPKLNPTIDTFEGVVNSHEWRVTIELNSDLSEKFLNAPSSDGPFKVIGDQLRRDPELLFTDPFKVLINVLQRRCVYPAPTSMVNFYIASDLKSAGVCRLTAAVQPLLYYISFTFGFQKGSRFTELVNQGLFLYFWQMGYFNSIRNKYFPVINRCRADAKREGKTTAFKLVDLVGAFALLGFGMASSVLVFLVEFIVGRHAFSRKKGADVMTRHLDRSNRVTVF